MIPIRVAFKRLNNTSAYDQKTRSFGGAFFVHPEYSFSAWIFALYVLLKIFEQTHTGIHMFNIAVGTTLSPALPALILTGLVLVFWLALNLVTYTFFQADKERAIHGEDRIPERTLLSLALIGGSLGAKVAQKRFRHKTCKQPFGRLLNAIVVLHLGLIALGTYYAFAAPSGFWTAEEFAGVWSK